MPATHSAPLLCACPSPPAELQIPLCVWRGL